MKISRIITRGFKTYRDTTVIGEFDAKLNCIVGLNGSGKSSLFQAIIFVLMPESSTQISSYLHEGSSGKSQSGFVELEFEDSSEISSLRRTISTDESPTFMVNGKNVSKSDYITLLQSVGLLGGRPSVQPYFVVEQGRVVSVATISDKNRFELIKEACGMDVFGARKTESMKILNDTQIKRDKIAELLNDIDSRCDQLQRESSELTEYSRLEKERDFLEYQIGLLEVEKLEERKMMILKDIEKCNHSIKLMEDELAALNTRKSVIGESVAESQELKELVIRKDQLNEAKSQIFNRLNLLTESFSAETLSLEKSKSVLNDLQSQLENLRQRENEVSDLVVKDKDEMNRVRSEITMIKSKRTLLERELETFEQMGSSSVEEMETRKSQIQLILSSLDLRIGGLESQLDLRKNELENLEKHEIVSTQNQLVGIENQVTEIEKVCESKLNEQYLIEKEKNEIETKLFELKTNKIYSHQKQIESMTREMNSLLNSVFRNNDRKSLSTREDLPPGVLGLFGDHIKIPSHYRRAVEICSKNALFNLVIERDDLADKLVSKFSGSSAKQFGRLTLLPINRIGDCQKERELVARIEADEEFKMSAKILSSVIVPVDESDWVKKLILKFFSKVAIVENVDVGFAIAKKYGIDAVTPDGDQISKHLILRSAPRWTTETSTGLRTNYSSVVVSWQQIVGLRKKLMIEKNSMMEISAQVKEYELLLSTLTDKWNQIGIVSVPQELVSKKNTMKRQLEQMLQRKSDLEKFEIPTIVGELEGLGKERDRSQTELRDLETKISDPNKPPTSSISKMEKEQKMTDLKAQIENATIEIEKFETTISRLSKKVSVNQSELVHFIGNKILSVVELMKERKTGIEMIERSILPQLQHQIEELNNCELNHVVKELEDVGKMEVVERERLAENQTELDSLLTRTSQITADLEVSRNQVIENEGKRENLENEISIIKSNSIRKLSELPTDIQITTNLSLLKSQMVSLVKVLNSPQYEALNKKAVLQFEKISTERSQLNVRRNEIEESDSAIRSLLDELRQKELNMIMSAFSKLKVSFEKLFARVTGGSGRAEIEMNLDDSDKTKDVEGSVRIRVGFPSEVNQPLEWKSMGELSGGQRTVVALCYLLSLHRAGESHAKFFILDEVDAALDAVYRSGIAEAVRQDSRENGTQFLFTSFRAELAAVADRHFLVTMSRGTSRVDGIDLGTALSLVNVDESSGANKTNNKEITRRTSSVSYRE